MKKEEKIPSFDDLKNPNYKYYYSREERLARRRQKQIEETRFQKKGILGYLSGGNPQVKSFISFYLFLALIFWLFIYLSNPPKTNERKIIKIDKYKNIKINIVNSKELKGLNIILENNGHDNWQIKKISLIEKATFTTNINLLVEPKNFEAIFLPFEKIPNLKKITLNIE